MNFSSFLHVFFGCLAKASNKREKNEISPQRDAFPLQSLPDCGIIAGRNVRFSSRKEFIMKQSYTVPVRLSEDLLRKLIYISENEGRTPQAQFTLMLRNTIQYHERAKSRIPAAELQKIDITPYMDKDETTEN